MKFTTTSVIAIGLSAQALANPTNVVRKSTKVQRDLAAFESVVSAVDAAVKQFDSDVKAYTSGDVSKLLSDSQSIITVTNSGVSNLQSEPVLSANDAFSLTSPVQGLSADVKTSIDDLVAKKSALVAAGAGGQVESGLQAQYTAAQSRATVISNKVPSSLAGVAAELSSGITDAIQSGIDAFKGTGSTSTSSSAGSTSTSSAAGSSSNGAATTSAAGTTVTSSAAASTGATSGSTSSAPSATSTVVVPSSGSSSSTAVVPGSSATGTSSGSVPKYTNGASSIQASGAVGFVAALLAFFAL
jgi:hypothetical protein